MMIRRNENISIQLNEFGSDVFERSGYSFGNQIASTTKCRRIERHDKVPDRHLFNRFYFIIPHQHLRSRSKAKMRRNSFENF
ncbi:hypothetical protein ASG47_09530 [Devosia sp. Leaf420]|nr:hypothetical protein ASG47_09530 [Devosia sp. Leaf420]